MTLNIELLRKTVLWVEQEEKRKEDLLDIKGTMAEGVRCWWDQGSWRALYGADGRELDEPTPECGTALCAAGYMVEVSQNGLKWSKLPGHMECVVIPGREDKVNEVAGSWGDHTGNHRPAYSVAYELLGVLDDTDLRLIAQLMFDGDNRAADVRNLAEEMAEMVGLELFPADEPAR